MVCQVADDVPTYVVRNTRTGKAKVLHRARLLLWLADYTQDGLEVNVLSLEDDVMPCTSLGARMNTVTPAYVHQHNLDMDPMTELE